MATRKRNEFLDPLSDEDVENDNDAGYDSAAEEESKGRTIKRRRKQAETETESEEEPEPEPEPEPDSEREGGIDQSKKSKTTQAPSSKPPTTKPVKLPKKNKTGVIYLSSLPPYLKPSALKSLLEQRGFSPITRVFLTPSTPSSSSSSSSSARKRTNKRKTYTDGWVEFASKRTAKVCAETLNANIVGGKKGGWYHDDVWNMKYLRGFKWGDLMEQVQRERSEREAKRRIEDARAKKEEKAYLEGVERGRVVEGIKRRNVEKGRLDKQGEKNGGEEEVRRVFRQNEVKGNRNRNGDEEGRGLDEGAKRVLGKIF